MAVEYLTMREMRYYDIITTLAWHEVKKVAHYYLSVDALRQPMEVREDLPTFRGETS